jgi:hypothetical protein
MALAATSGEMITTRQVSSSLLKSCYFADKSLRLLEGRAHVIFGKQIGQSTLGGTMW